MGTTYEPLSITATDDPVSCAIYTKENGLLDTPGWHCFKPLAKWDQRQIQMANKAKLKTYSRMPKFKSGYHVLTITRKPCSWARSMATPSGHVIPVSSLTKRLMPSDSGDSWGVRAYIHVGTIVSILGFILHEARSHYHLRHVNKNHLHIERVFS